MSQEPEQSNEQFWGQSRRRQVQSRWHMSIPPKTIRPRADGKTQRVRLRCADRWAWALALLLLSPAAALAEKDGFDSAREGKLPEGWTAAMTGKGQPRWTVVRDDTAPSRPHALQQSGEATFPLCIKDDTVITDGSVEVKFKALSGKVDQAGGLIWRCSDPDNYYIARANALENNVTIYTTVKGKRTAFKNVELPVAAGAWHTLRVEFAGNRFKVLFNGKAVLEATDETFTHAGKVGLWTKADSVTVFDDFTCESR